MSEAPPIYNSRVIKNYLEYLEHHHPDVSLDRLLAASGIGRAEVEDPGHWLTQDQIDRFHAAMDQAAHDPQIPREAGRFAQASQTSGMLKRYVLGFMTPMMAYRAMGRLASEWTRGHEFTTQPLSSRSVAVTVTPQAGVHEQAFQCANRIGKLEAVAKLFTGRFAVVEHPTCLHRDGESCIYHISWEPMASGRWKQGLRFASAAAGLSLFIAAGFLTAGHWLVFLLGWGALLGCGWTVSVAIENMELKRSIADKGDTADLYLQEIKYRYSSAFLIQEIGKAASVLHSPQAFVTEVLPILEKRLDYRGAVLWLIDENRPEILQGNGYGLTPDRLDSIRELHLDSPRENLGGLLDAVCRQGTSVVADQPGEIARRFPAGAEMLERLGVKAFIAVPLENESRILGMLMVFSDQGNQRTSFSDINLISGVASQVALGLVGARAYHRLQESRDLFDSFMGHLPALAFIKDREGRYIYTNQWYSTLFGEPRGYRLGKTDQDLWPAEEARELMANDRRVFDEKCVVSTLEATCRGDRTQYWQVTKFPFYKDGQALYVGGVAFDVSDRMQTEEAKQELEFQLLQTQKMEAIGTLAGGIAHDFNNILSAIIGFTEMSLLDVPPKSGLSDNLGKVLQAGGRARDLVKQILTFSRQSPMDPRPIQLHPIVKEALKLLRASLPTTVKMDSFIQPAGTVMADPTQIHQLIMNLCTNARDAMEGRDGTLTVILEPVAMGAQEAARHPRLRPGKFCKLTVCDTGQGIPAHVLERIFDPFFTTKGEGRGTGMGLAVVHGIVERIAGAISVESRVGEGTCFVILLPAIEARTSDVLPASLKVPGGTERILFVDDEPFQTDLGCQLLGRLGYRVSAFNRSPDAWRAFQTNPQAYDLVITDMTMPEMTGDELARRVLSLRPDMPVVLCTGYSEGMTEEVAAALGIRGFVMKPVVIRELALLLRQILGVAPGG